MQGNRPQGTPSALLFLAMFLILLAAPALHAQFSTDQLLSSPEKLYQYAQGLNLIFVLPL